MNRKKERSKEQAWRETVVESEIREGEMTVVSLGDDEEAMVTRYHGRICACGNACPHYGAPLDEGELNDGVITCPYHFARYHVEDGRLVSPPSLDGIASYPVKVEGGRVMIGSAEQPRIAMPSGRDDRTFLIAGGGAAGNAAAEQLRREGFAGRIVMLTPESDRPYDRPMISKGLLSGDAEPGWLPLRSETFYRRLQIDIRTGSGITSLDPGSRTVTMEDGRTLSGDRILLATGSRPRRPDIPGGGLPNVFALRSAADARAILSAVNGGGGDREGGAAGGGVRRALILGASFIGMEVAAELAQRGLEVHVAAPEEAPMSLAFGERIGVRVRTIHEENGVVFHMGTTARELKGEASGNGGVETALLSDGSSVDADIVIYGLGVDPVVDYLDETGLVRSGAVPVNDRLETEAEGIFAAGDVAAVDTLGRTGVRVEHWVVAQKQGRHAAGAMLGQTEPYAEVPFFWTRQYTTSLKYIGFPGPADRIAYSGDVGSGSFAAGFFTRDVSGDSGDGPQKGAGERIRGAAALGRNGALIAIERAILEGRAVGYDDFGGLVGGGTG